MPEHPLDGHPVIVRTALLIAARLELPGLAADVLRHARREEHGYGCECEDCAPSVEELKPRPRVRQPWEIAA